MFLLWDLWWNNDNKNGDPKNGQTPVALRSFCSHREGLLGLFSPYWVYGSGILGQVWIHFSSFLSFHDVKFQSAFFSNEVGLNSPVKFDCFGVSLLYLRLVLQSPVGMLLLKKTLVFLMKPEKGCSTPVSIWFVYLRIMFLLCKVKSR